MTEDGGVMVLPEDEALPDFKDTIRFEPREIIKYFEVGALRMLWLVCTAQAVGGGCIDVRLIWM